MSCLLRCVCIGWVCVVWMLSASWAVGADPDDLRLTLPPRAFAVVGSEIGIDFDNIVLTPTPEALDFVVTCDVGDVARTKWSLTATPQQVGTHHWQVAVRRDGQTLAEKSLELLVVPAQLAQPRDVNLLIVGDSLTHASITANDLQQRLSQPGQPRVQFLGTHRPANAAPGVAHEGYGGWTWQRFATHYEPQPDVAARRFSSPFVFLDADTPRLDVARYFAEKTDQRRPDVVLFLLGINDCFAANPDDPAALDARIDQVLQHAETLLKDFRRAAPAADLAICLTTPPNTREEAFTANYKGRYSRWNWKRIQHRLVERELQQFVGRESERIFVVPTELNLDPIDGYPPDNAVHPNPQGYQQIAASMHAWLLQHLQPSPP